MACQQFRDKNKNKSQQKRTLTVLKFIIFSIPSKSLIYIVLSPVISYAIFVNCTSFCGFFTLISNVLVYYIMRFCQINTQLHFFHKIKRISLQTLIQTINEHNDLSLSIHKLNPILSKSVGSLFIISACVVDLLIYLLIHTKSLYYKILFMYCFAVAFGAISIINILLICDEITVNSECIVHAFTMHALIVHVLMVYAFPMHILIVHVLIVHA